MSALAERNRRILAERLDWPDGAVEVCERLEVAHPGWCVSWFHEWKVPANSYWHREEGFYAWLAEHEPLTKLATDKVGRRPELYGADAQAIAEQLQRSA